MNKRMLRFFQYCLPGILMAHNAVAHEIGSPHQHDAFGDFIHSILQPAHMLIIIGIALVVYLVLTRSAHK